MNDKASTGASVRTVRTQCEHGYHDPHRAGGGGNPDCSICGGSGYVGGGHYGEEGDVRCCYRARWCEGGVKIAEVPILWCVVHKSPWVGAPGGMCGDFRNPWDRRTPCILEDPPMHWKEQQYRTIQEAASTTC